MTFPIYGNSLKNMFQTTNQNITGGKPTCWEIVSLVWGSPCWIHSLDFFGDFGEINLVTATWLRIPQDTFPLPYLLTRG